MISEQRIENGALLENERAIAEAVIPAEAYLAARYPEGMFTIKGLPAIGARVPFTLLVLDGYGRQFELAVSWTKADRSDITFVDDYYGLYRENEIRAYIASVLRSCGLTEFKIHPGIGSISSKVADASVPAAKLLAGGVKIHITASVYMAKADAGEFDAAAVAQGLTGKGLTGSVLVWVMPEVPDGEPDHRWYNRYCMGKQDLERYFIAIPDGEAE